MARRALSLHFSRGGRVLRRALLTLSIATWSAVGAAQGARDPAGAEKLYDDAATLLSSGDFARACPMFEQSQKLDPSPGALLNLAGCAEHDGKLATAWSFLRDARSLNVDTASAKRREEIQRFVDAGLARLEPRIPTLSIHLATPPKDARVLRDGKDVTGSLDQALPVDPGEHVIEALAPGYVSDKQIVAVAEGTHPTLELTLGKETSLGPPLRPVATKPHPPTPGKQGEPAAPRDEPGLGGAQLAGLVLGGAGVASIAASIVTGVLAGGKQSDLEALGCTDKPGSDGGTVLCSPTDVTTAQDLSSSGSTLATVSTVTTFAGIGLAGAGVALFIVGTVGGDASPNDARVVPLLGPGVLGLSISGAL